MSGARVSCGFRHPDRIADVPAGDLGIRIAANGSYGLLVWCHECACWATGTLPLHYLARLGLRPVDLPVVSDYRGTIGRCSVRGCDSEDVELNHFAPQATFGGDADAWPVGYLCRAHHREWGERVTPHLNAPRKSA